MAIILKIFTITNIFILKFPSLKLSEYLEHKKFQKKHLCEKRRKEREGSSSVCLKIPLHEEVDYFIKLMNDPNTLVDGITGLDDLCSTSKVYIEQNQFTTFVNILENYNQNPEILEHTVILINKILQFEVDCSSELFCTDIFLDFFFSNLESPYSIDSLYHISKTSKHCAIPVLEYSNSYPNIIDLLLSNESENFELNLTFFSSFLLYKKDVFVEFVSKVMIY